MNNTATRESFPDAQEGPMTPREEYAKFYIRGVQQDATHFFVVHNTTTKEHFAVYVMPGEDPGEQRTSYGKPYQVSDIYDLNMPIEPQLNRSRVLL